MRRAKKSMFFLVCMLCTMFFNPIQGQATGPIDGQIIDGSRLTSDIEATDSRPLMLKDPFVEKIQPYGVFLSSGTAHIENAGSGTIYMTGETYCYETCDTVKVNLYLERLEDGVWNNVTMTHHTANNTYYTKDGMFYAVKKGYYYRVRGSHAATKNGKTETTTTCTNGIYIS